MWPETTCFKSPEELLKCKFQACRATAPAELAAEESEGSWT